MSLLRIIGYFGLVLILLIVLFGIYISISENNWQGIAIFGGALIFLGFLGNGLWLEGFKQKYPNVNVTPNKTISVFLFLVLGIFGGMTSINMFISHSWLYAVITLVMAITLFEMAYDVFRRT